MSPNTIESYSTAFRLLLEFAHQQLNKEPSKLLLEDLDAPFISRFLDHLESARGNSARTRNARLAAIHAFFKYVAYREPRHSALIQRVLNIPAKCWEKKPVDFLKRNQVEVLLQAPDLSTWLGRRDRALIALMAQTGLRDLPLPAAGLHQELPVLRNGTLRSRGSMRPDQAASRTLPARTRVQSARRL